MSKRLKEILALARAGALNDDNIKELNSEIDTMIEEKSNKAKEEFKDYKDLQREVKGYREEKETNEIREYLKSKNVLDTSIDLIADKFKGKDEKGREEIVGTLQKDHTNLFKPQSKPLNTDLPSSAKNSNDGKTSMSNDSLVLK